MKTCTFENCTNKHDSHGFCANHARQYRKYGHVLSLEEKSEIRRQCRSKSSGFTGKKRTEESKRLQSEKTKGRTLCMACHYYITFKKKMPSGLVWGHNLKKKVEA